MADSKTVLTIKLSKKNVKKFRKGDAAIVAKVEAKKAAANHTGPIAVVEKKDKTIRNPAR